MTAGHLDQWARFLARMTRAGGTATLIHKAEALGEVLACLSRRFGGLSVLPIQPRPSTPAIRILVQGTRGSRAPLVLHPPFTLHGSEGHGFSAEAEAILKHGASLAIAGPRTGSS